MACVFFLLSFLSYHDPGFGGRIGTSVVLAALSMLAKETGVTVLVVNLLLDLYRSWGPLRRALRDFGSVPLVTSLGDCRNLATCALFGVGLLVAYRCLVDFEIQRHPPLILGLLLLCIPFLPASNLLVTVGFVIAERVLYIPSLGMVLLVVYGSQLLWNALFVRQRHVILVAAMLVLGGFCLRTVVRNRDWATRESLALSVLLLCRLALLQGSLPKFSQQDNPAAFHPCPQVRSGVRDMPNNAKLHYNMGNTLRDTGRKPPAISHYKEALRLWPSYASAHNNLGTLAPSADEAERFFLSAIHFQPAHVNAHYNLGHVYK
ncbi:hypothetical protein FOCC_FOCC000103 [Frankliniella occidentalis]|nr:hypothetical protein FOCC_FOCC000103 [Frankliniella occidentalis]